MRSIKLFFPKDSKDVMIKKDQIYFSHLNNFYSNSINLTSNFFASMRWQLNDIVMDYNNE